MSKYFSAALFFAACLALSNCYGNTNLIANPGFEDSNSKAWAGRGAAFATTTEQKHSGLQCGKATDRTADWQGIKQSLLGEMQVGNTYQISGWVRLENTVAANIMVSVEQKDDNGSRYFNVAKADVTDSNWVQLSGSFTLEPMGALQVLDVYFEGPPAGTNFYVDDITIVGPSAAAVAEPNAAPAKPAEPNAVAKDKANMK